MLVGGRVSSTARGFCTAPPGLVSLETAIAVLRLTVTVSTSASSRPLSCCLSVRRSVLPTCRVTTSAFDGDSTLICSCSATGTLLVDHELVGVERLGVERRTGSVGDQRGVQVERDLGDLALGVGGQQQRGNQQGGPQAP